MDYLVIFIGWYTTYIGIEILSIMIGMTQDVAFMAAWASVLNVFNIFWIFGTGMANVVRTDVSSKVGEFQIAMAKKFAIMGLILGYILSISIGVLVIVFHRPMSRIFSKVTDVLDDLYTLMWLMGMCIMFTGGLTT